MTTNNRMELTAALRALEALKHPCQVELTTDSQYLQKGVTEWLPVWKRKKWLTASRRPVKNRDLWESLDVLAATHEIQWRWVRAHNGHPQNEAADRLAYAAMLRIRQDLHEGGANP